MQEHRECFSRSDAGRVFSTPDRPKLNGPHRLKGLQCRLIVPASLLWTYGAVVLEGMDENVFVPSFPCFSSAILYSHKVLEAIR